MTDVGLSTDITLEDLYIMDVQVSDGVHGRVYKGIDRESSKKQFAIKEIYLPAGDINEIVTRFEVEAGSLAAVECEGLPKLRKFMVENDSAYLISDWVEGENLEETLRKNHGPLPVFDVLSLMMEAANILKVLHSEKYKIIHGDIKPVNLKVPYPGKIALTDLGSNEILKLYPLENYVLPREFSAPEAMSGKPAFSWDTYSLFAVGHYMLCGIKPEHFPPFSLPPIQDLNPNVNDRVANFFRKGLSYYPDHRYKNIAEIVNDIELCLRLVPTDSIYADRFNCPGCSSVLPRGVKICTDCSLDFGIYDGTDNPDNYIRRGNEYLDTDRIIRADRCFYQAAKLGNDNVKLFTSIAHCRFLSGESDLAKGMLKNLMQKFSSSSIPCIELVKIYREEGDLKDADDMLAYLKLNHSDDVNYLLFTAEDFLKNRDAKKAYSIVENILKENPHNREALELKGKILKKSGKRNLLAEFLLEQKELHRNGGMELELALYYKAGNDLSSALRCMVHGMSKELYNPIFRSRAASILKEMGMVGTACKTMMETLPLVRGNPEYFRKAVTLMIEEGEIGEALPFLHYIYTRHNDPVKNSDFALNILELLKSTKPKTLCEPVERLVKKYCLLLKGEKAGTEDSI